MSRVVTQLRPQIIIFGVIGFLNTLLHGLVLLVSVELLYLPVVVAHSFAFLSANIFSYLLNTRFTFNIPPSIVFYVKFFMGSIASFFLTLMISSVAEWYGLHYWFGFSVIVVCVPALSFLLMKFWIFRFPGANTIS